MSKLVSDRVSFETSFDSKQPKLEPKLVSALSETKRLFRLFCPYTETESFDVSIEPKQTEDQRKQFDRENILLFFTENLGFIRFIRFFRFFCFLGLLRLFRFYTEAESFRCFDWTETKRRPTQTNWKRVYLGNFQKIYGCFETPKQTKIFCFWFHETNQNKPETDLVSVVSDRTEIYFCMFRGHPSLRYPHLPAFSY